MEVPSDLETDLVVFCSGKENYASEGSLLFESLFILFLVSYSVILSGQILSEIVYSLEQSGAKYSVLYASDHQRSGQQSLNQPFVRFLSEGAHQNQSANLAFCDGVCLIKSSLLEGLFVVSNIACLCFVYGHPLIHVVT